MKTYTIPTTEAILLRSEYAVLVASEIFKDDNGKADHFDTRRQDAWMDWCDEDDE